MQKTPELIAHLNTLGVADVDLKNGNVVKISFQQGVSQKTWSKKELTDICAAFCAGRSSVADQLNEQFRQDFVNCTYTTSVGETAETLLSSVKRLIMGCDK